jgi:hypothetical protein
MVGHDSWWHTTSNGPDHRRAADPERYCPTRESNGGFHAFPSIEGCLCTKLSECITRTPLSSIDLSGVVPVAFTLMFIVWGIFSLVIIYHWFRYRHKSWFAVPAIALHIFVSGWIIIYMVNALK